MSLVLENDPEFRARYERVWLWADWPGRWGPDQGVDLIAQTFTGRVDAVQAKEPSRLSYRLAGVCAMRRVASLSLPVDPKQAYGSRA
ncbi:MAG: hypothetical protein WBP81_31080 [Solirubrobacteraceae bacterium]